MKRKILVPVFASLMAFSMNAVDAHADEVENNKENEKNNSLKVRCNFIWKKNWMY